MSSLYGNHYNISGLGIKPCLLYMGTTIIYQVGNQAVSSLYGNHYNILGLGIKRCLPYMGTTIIY